ncbi:hypothetical protein BGZ83_008848 [Gryganskiella cystojenkinii]|nr:hypothetical protein BGZ83_008848 [Gryganskiella cystojenkinii]
MDSSAGKAHQDGSGSQEHNNSNNNSTNINAPPSSHAVASDGNDGVQDTSDWETDASTVSVESTTGVNHLPEETSEWETESSGEDDADDEDIDDSLSDVVSQGDDELQEEWEDEDGNPLGGDQGDGLWDDENGYDVEFLAPSVRAVRKINLEDDDYSDFSGDEKYEPKQQLSGNNGEGENDMFDRSHLEQFDASQVETGHLSSKIRQLMLQLKRGQRNRVRKLGIAPATTTPTTVAGMEARQGLNEIMVRGPDYPQEVEHSPAISFHHQCAHSLTVSPSAMGLWDDLYTINEDMIMRCGVLPRMTDSTYIRRLNASIGSDEYYDDRTAQQVFRPYSQPLRTVKATKFLPTSIYRFNELPTSEAYVSLGNNEEPLCIGHKYGYLAHGATDGSLVVYCTDCGGEPMEIHNDVITGSPEDMMLNSIQVVRWPRYYRTKTYPDDNDDDVMDVDADDPLDASDEDAEDDDEYDLKEGYPTKSGQFDHYMVMTGNDHGLFIAALPDHPSLERRRQARANRYGDVDIHEHIFKFKEDHTWIKNGFRGEALNDAKVSPNGRWIAVVGDSARVFTVEVTHVPETEDQRIKREIREQELALEDLDTDSEYFNSDDEMEAVEEKLGIADPQPKNDSRREQSTDRARVQESSSSPEKSTRKQLPRLLHQFGHPQEHLIPDRVLHGQNSKKRRRLHSDYTSQYVAWNSTSTKFAHSSDSSSKVIVWSMPSKEIVCCVDTGGFSYAIEFHPKLENVFAVNNWYGFVHVVDITGCCVGDEDLVPDVELNSQGPVGGSSSGRGEAWFQGPHYEEKHDILMCSFRGERDKSLRILDGLRGLGWSTDGRYLYVSTLRRVLRFELKDNRVRIPSLFHLCARKVREWKEREMAVVYTKESEASLKRYFGPLAKDWEYVPYQIKRKIWGDLFSMRSHNE